MVLSKQLKQLRSRLIAGIYDIALAPTERRCLGEWRRELLAQSEGTLLEIGAGTGINLRYYPQQATRILLCEPDPQMRQQLQIKTAHAAQTRVEITGWQAEAIDLPDDSIDTIVTTLVLCSVASLETSLREIHRLLKPDGKLLFLEHVISNDPRTRRWQQRIEPFWSLCAADCHLTRDTERAIRTAGFNIEQLIEAPISGAPAFLRRTIRGLARKPTGAK